jgi:hypothetical protein
MTGRQLALLLCLCGCGPTALPPPRIVSISPSQMVACEGATVSVNVEAVLPTRFDYGQSQVSANPDVSLRIGAVPVGSGKYAPGGLLTAAVPPVFAPGSYDVGLRVSDGRPEAILPDGFTVSPNPYPESYSIDFVRDQTQGQPFAITIRAVGPNASAYNCTVGLSSNRGTISPTVSGNFQVGVRTERVAIDSPQPSVVITVQDDIGRSGSSNAFRVNP